MIMNLYSMKNTYYLIFLVTAVSIVYYPILLNDFLYAWDDQWVVMNQYTTGGWSLSNIFHIFIDFYHGQYAPFNELSYLILYSFFGYDPLHFHLASLLYHIANTVLVFVFIRKLLQLSNTEKKEDINFISFITALLFAVHPVNVESVAWVSASKVLVYTLFYLFGLICYLKYVITRNIIYYIITLLLFIFSFWGKEQAVTFPVCLLLIDYFIKKDMRGKNCWIEKLPFFVLSLFFGLVTVLSQEDGGGAPIYPLVQRLVFACYTLIEYLTKAIFPVNLSYLYPFPIQPGESLPLRFWIYPLIVIALLVWIYSIKSKKILVFCTLFFILHVSVALHLISLSRFAIVADRYLYVGIIGIAFLVSVLISHLKKRWYIQPVKWRILLFVLLLYISYNGIYTFQYCHDWNNTNSLKKHMRGLIDSRRNLLQNKGEIMLMQQLPE